MASYGWYNNQDTIVDGSEIGELIISVFPGACTHCVLEHLLPLFITYLESNDRKYIKRDEFIVAMKEIYEDYPQEIIKGILQIACGKYTFAKLDQGTVEAVYYRNYHAQVPT